MSAVLLIPVAVDQSQLRSEELASVPDDVLAVLASVPDDVLAVLASVTDPRARHGCGTAVRRCWGSRCARCWPARSPTWQSPYGRSISLGSGCLVLGGLARAGGGNLGDDGVHLVHSPAQADQRSGR